MPINPAFSRWSLTSYVHLLDLLLGQAVRRLVPAIDVDTLSSFSGHGKEYLGMAMKELRNSADEVTYNAELIEWLIDRPRYREGEVSQNKKVTATMYAKLAGVVEAINATAYLEKYPNHQFSNPQHLFSIDGTEIEHWLDRLQWYRPGIARQAGMEIESENEQKYEVFDLPNSGKQLELAQMVVAWIEQALLEGQPPDLKPAAVKKRFKKLELWLKVVFRVVEKRRCIWLI